MIVVDRFYLLQCFSLRITSHFKVTAILKEFESDPDAFKSLINMTNDRGM
jgi:hypothetical protein